LEGITAGAALVDEWELCSPVALDTAMARVSMGPCQQILLTGTPEGFGPCYEKILGNPSDKVRLWTVATSANSFLSKDYVSKLQERMDESTATEKLEGVRTAKAGRVYSRFDRRKNCVPVVKPGTGRIAIACDFNVRYMHWLICEIDDENRKVHVLDECIKQGGTTTDEHAERTMKKIGEVIQRTRGITYTFDELFQKKFKAYGDASGSAQKSVSARSDLYLLIQGGFRTDIPAKNPPVQDRINTVQCLIRDKRISVDEKCVQLIRSLETQAWDKNGEPEKRDNVDHCCDAIGYLCHRLFPVHRPKANDAAEYKELKVDEWGIVA
jgi:hypothetical protein